MENERQSELRVLNSAENLAEEKKRHRTVVKGLQFRYSEGGYGAQSRHATFSLRAPGPLLSLAIMREPTPFVACGV